MNRSMLVRAAQERCAWLLLGLWWRVQQERPHVLALELAVLDNDEAGFEAANERCGAVVDLATSSACGVASAALRGRIGLTALQLAIMFNRVGFAERLLTLAPGAVATAPICSDGHCVYTMQIAACLALTSDLLRAQTRPPCSPPWLRSAAHRVQRKPSTVSLAWLTA